MPKKVEDCVASFMRSEANKKKWPDEMKRRQAAYAICNDAIKDDETKTRAYATDLSGIQLSEEDGTWVHMLSYGEYYHPIFGDINITEEKVDHFVANYKENVRGIDLDIDYAHKMDAAKGDKAAGWILDVQKRNDGLWGLVKFTGEAIQEVTDGAWKYFSVEYMDEWCNNQSPPQCWPDVLLGGALTNRPYMKNLTPINFSEFFDQPAGKVPQEDAHYRMAEDSMYRCANCEFFRPSDNACLVVDGEIGADFTSNYFRPIYNETLESMMYTYDDSANSVKLQMALKSDTPKEEVNMNEFLQKLFDALGIEKVEEGKEEEATETALAEIKRLSEEAAKPAEIIEADPDADKKKKFAEEYPEEARVLAEQAVQLKEAHVTRKFGEWNKVPPVLHEALHDHMVKLSETDLASFEEIIGQIQEKGLVDLSEKGSAKGGDVADNDSERFLAEVQKFQEEQKKPDGSTYAFAEAVQQVARANPELAKAYQASAKAM